MAARRTLPARPAAVPHPGVETHGEDAGRMSPLIRRPGPSPAVAGASPDLLTRSSRATWRARGPPPLLEWLDTALMSLGFLAFVILGLAACLEYVVPPIPGDTVILLGGVMVVRGHQPLALVFIAVVTGSVLGSTLAYAFGAWLRRRMELKPDARHLFGLTPKRLAAVDRQMLRWGAWLLILNRFLPGVRSVIFIAAGSSRLSPGRTLALGALAAALHTTAVLAAGWAVGGNLERLERWLTHTQWVVGSLAGLAVLALTVRYFAGRRRAPEPE